MNLTLIIREEGIDPGTEREGKVGAVLETGIDVGIINIIKGKRGIMLESIMYLNLKEDRNLHLNLLLLVRVARQYL